MKTHKKWLVVKRRNAYAVTTREGFYEFWQGCGFLAFSAHATEREARKYAQSL